MQPSSLTSRLAAVALLVVVIVVIASAAAKPLWARYTANREHIAELESQAARFEAIANRQSYLEKQLAGLESKLDRGGLMFEADSAVLAAASLQEKIKAVVGETGGTLVSTQVLDAAPADAFERVSVNVRMTASTPQLQASLYALESNLPVLVVDDLLVVSRRAPVRLRNKIAAGADQLDVRFKVSGFYDPKSKRN